MNLEKYFSDAFGAKCIMTSHALKRITERFMYAELEKLKLLIQLCHVEWQHLIDLLVNLCGLVMM